ncbi:MAG: YceI family protein [Bacteroidetes bacterium]|nr:MAG: YceI family protein [Bacteroidota bacterium]
MKITRMNLLATAAIVATGLIGFSFINVTPASVATTEEVAGKASYKADPATSSIAWKAYKVTGQHNGAVTLKSGQLDFNDNKLTGGTFEIDMTSMTVLDLQGDMAGKLAGHLKSDDFFSVANHPSAKLVITAVTSKGNGAYSITGDLTIKGISKPITFDATASSDKTKSHAEATLKINRTNYDIRYRSANFFENLGDKAIYDEFDITVKIEAFKQGA